MTLPIPGLGQWFPNLLWKPSALHLLYVCVNWAFLIREAYKMCRAGGPSGQVWEPLL